MKFTARHKLPKSYVALIALVAATGITLALSTFASGNAATVWRANGSQATKCGNTQRPCLKQGAELFSFWNFQADYRVPAKRAGHYKILLDYRSSGTPPDGYRHHFTLKANGRTVDTGEVPFDTHTSHYNTDEFELKEPLRTLSVAWTNDFYAPLQDVNVSIVSLTLQRIPEDSPTVVLGKPAPHKAAPRQPVNRFARGSMRYYAQQILDDSRSSKPQISLNDETRSNLQDIAAGRCSPVPASHACVKLDRRLLRSLWIVSRHHRVHVWHFTEGPHVGCSNHYEGRAMDLQEFDGSWPPARGSYPARSGNLLGQFRSLGATELLGPGFNYAHRDHWHVAWDGTHHHCR